MNQNLKKSGVSLLNALSNHSEIVMEAYFAGQLNESDYSPKIIANLVDMNILWRPDSEQHLRLKPALRALLEESLKDESTRQVDANIGASLATIKTRAEHYKESVMLGKYHEADANLADITERVYALTDMLSTNVRLIWSRISNEFGYVATVDAKIRENELAQSQVSDLLNQLSLFEFDKLSEIAGVHRDLRQLLVVTLQSSFARCTQELSLAQSKLIDLLGRFREFKGRTRLLKGFVLHLAQRPDFAPQNYATLSNVPDLFNIAQSTIKPAAPDVNNVEHEFELIALIEKIKQTHQVIKQPNQSHSATNPLTLQDTTEVELARNAIKEAVEGFFVDVIDTGVNTTALEYYESRGLEFDQEVWLYQVIGGYHGLPDSDKDYFAIETVGQPDPTFTGNFVIKDIEIGLR
jgi:hypothetical protein